MTQVSRPSKTGWWRLLLAAAVAALVGLLGATTASAATVPNLETRVGASTPVAAYVVGTHECISAGQRWGNAPPQAVSVAGCGVAAKTADIGGAKFAQKSFSETFSSGGAFAGRTIDDVAGDLRSGALTAKDVPIDVIVRDGNTLILNTRSSQALIRAGVPRSGWNVIDRTGQAAFESRLTGQLTRNGLTSGGTDLP